jgi:hypothetical protein
MNLSLLLPDLFIVLMTPGSFATTAPPDVMARL